MYPQTQLNALAVRKAAVLGASARHRQLAVAALVRVARPLHWLDEMIAWGRRWAPLGLLATSLWSRPKPGPAQKFPVFRTVLRWAPLLWSAGSRWFAASRNSLQREPKT